MPILTVARVDRASGVVLNIELVDAGDFPTLDDPVVEWIPYTDDQPAIIGRAWHPVDGFEQLPAVESITVTPAELEQLVDERIVERQLEADVAVAESAGVKIDREPG